MNVVILGASPKPDRFSFLAQKRLIEEGHQTIPISLSGEPILGISGYQSIGDIPDSDKPVHTVTVYMNPQRFEAILDDVLAAKPERIIFNPGTESVEISNQFRQSGIEVVEDCTLIMLDQGTF